MSSTEFEEKIEQYEQTAVEVANTMYNPNLRAESSKEVLENFPNVRLASEKKQEKVKRGRGLLPSLLISAIVGIGCFGLGYNVRTNREKTERINYSIEELIKQDLTNNQGFTFNGDLDFFAEMYSLKLFSLKPRPYITDAVKQHFQKYIDPKNPNMIVYKKRVEGGLK